MAKQCLETAMHITASVARLLVDVFKISEPMFFILISISEICQQFTVFLYHFVNHISSPSIYIIIAYNTNCL